MKGLILAFALFFSSAGAPPPSNQELIGSWRLVGFTRTVVATGQTFETFGKRPSGFIQFGNDGRMTMLIAHLPGSANRQRFQTDSWQSDSRSGQTFGEES
jgi:hypothetical protein